MRIKVLVVALLLTIASLIFSACATPTTQPSTPQVTEVVKTVVVTVEGKEVVVTATPEPTASPPEYKPKDRTTYTKAAFGAPRTLDPALDNESAGIEILRNVYDTLVLFNKDDPNSFVPQLAIEVPTVENGGISADGTTYLFKIRQGVKFHDGSELTPGDVAYTFQRNLLQGGTASLQWLIAEPILGVGIHDIADVVDPVLEDDPIGLQDADPDRLMEACQRVTSAIIADDAAGTVIFKLAQPWAPWLATIAQPLGSIQSKAWVIASGGWDGDCATWQQYYGKTYEQINDTPLGAEAMGTGPYKLDQWTPGEEIVLKANSNYWRTEPAWDGGPTGAPTLKTIMIKQVDQFRTRYAMLQSGDADSITTDSTSDWPELDSITGSICNQTDQDCQPSVNPDQPLELIRSTTLASRTDVLMNFQVNIEGGNNFVGSDQLDGNGIPPDFFSDIHVRKAFAYCFNYNAYLNDVLLGEGVRSPTVMLPGMSGYDENAPQYSYDPAKCEEEFKASTLTSPNGKSLWDTGFRLSMVYDTGNTQGQTIAQIFQRELSAINKNFLLEVTGLPLPNFLKDQSEGRLPIFSTGWTEVVHDTSNWVQPYSLGTLSRLQSMPSDLQARFADIISAAIVETDPARRDALYREFNQLFYDQVPTILLYLQNGRRYQQRWVQGWFFNPVYGTNSDYYYVLSKR